MNIVFFMYSLIPLIDVLPCVHCVQKIFQGAQKSSVTQQFSAAHHVRTISNVGTLLLCSSQCVLLGEMQCCKSFTYIESERLCHHFDKEAKATDLTFNTSSITYAVTRSNISSISKCHQYYFSQKDDIKKSWHDARQYCRNKWNGQGHLLRIETKEVKLKNYIVCTYILMYRYVKI